MTRSNTAITIGIVTIDNNVVNTYNAPDSSISRSYNCTIEFSAEHTGVMPDKNTVIKIALPSGIQVCAFSSHNNPSVTIGYKIKRKNTVK